MTELVIHEPKYVDSPERCFKLPLLACETLTTNIQAISESILGKHEQ